MRNATVHVDVGTPLGMFYILASEKEAVTIKFRLGEAGVFDVGLC